jgi:anti-sigma B factor antagonist
VPSLVEHANEERGGAVTPKDCEVDDAGLGDAPGVAVHGEVDINGVEVLETTIEHAILESAGAFVIDLTDVGFLDSSGLAVLLRARALLGREDRALALVCPPGAARRAFEVSGCAELFNIYESRDDAIAALVPATD